MTEEEMRACYKAGGRLRVLIEFVVEIGAGVYRIMSVLWRELSKEESQVWEWLGRQMQERKIGVKVNFGIYWASVGAYKKLVQFGRYWREWVDVVFGTGESLSFGVNIEGGRVVHWGWKICADAEDVKRVKIVFEFLKREIEECVNGVLERLLFE
jgi:hypothetical protein